MARQAPTPTVPELESLMWLVQELRKELNDTATTYEDPTTDPLTARDLDGILSMLEVRLMLTIEERS